MKTKVDVDREVARLSNAIRDQIHIHGEKIKHLGHGELLTSVAIALSIEVGRLKWLCVSTGSIRPDKFDEIFNEGVLKHYESNIESYGISH